MVVKTIVDALVTSHLDYTNGLLIGISNTEHKKLQRIQNKAAKIVLKRKSLIVPQTVPESYTGYL